jgi:hypothetical protein
MEKENHKPSAYPISKRLVIKAIGEIDQITHFIEDMQKIYPEDRMNFSPILRNSDAPGYHCFINLLMPLPIQSNAGIEVREVKDDASHR